MITTDLTGNIGDHITRYLICRSVAEKNGYSWGINKIASHDYYGGKEQMDFLSIDYGEFCNTSYGELPENVINIWEEKNNHFSTHDFYYFQPDIFDVSDNTKLIVKCCHDERYFEKEKVKNWLKIKPEYANIYAKTLNDYHIILDKDLCIINIRGNEYRGVPNLLLPKQYYEYAMNIMLKRNPKMRFLIITDDVNYCHNLFYPSLSIAHFSIGIDYFILNHAQNLILSNSAFGIFPTYTNENLGNVIAPLHWARHNLEIWANSSIWTFGFDFVDKNGKVFLNNEISKEIK